MPLRGDASNTRLTDIKLRRKGDKNTLSVYLSGEHSLDLAAIHKALRAVWPKELSEVSDNQSAFIDMDNGSLRIAIPVKADEEGCSVPDIVEKIFDATRCDLGFHFELNALPTGPMFLPEVVIEIEHPHPDESLLGRTVTEVIRRKLNPAKSDDPLKEYLIGAPSKDGHKLVVRPRREKFPTEEGAISYANVMMYHFKQKLDVASVDTRMTGIEGVFLNGHEDGEERKQPDAVCLTLSGKEDALRRARLLFMRGNNNKTRVELITASGNNPAILHVTEPSQSFAEAAEAIRMVHMVTGCELPVNYYPSLLMDERTQPPTYQPAVALYFDTADTNCNSLFVQSMAIYIASNLSGKGKINFPIVPRAGQQEPGLDLDQPVSIIGHKIYELRPEAEAEATIMADHLTSMLQFKAPPADRAL